MVNLFCVKCIGAYVQMIWRGVILLCILVLPSRVAAYGSRFHHSFSVSLPRLTVREGISLLHGPERWANGVGLLVGLPPFHIRKVSEIELGFKKTQGLMNEASRRA